MKKLLSLVLSLALLGALALPALAAEENSADARLAGLTQTVKEALELDTSVYDDFSGSLVEGELLPTWRLRWSGEDGSLTLTATETGRILTYNRNRDAAIRPGGAFAPAFPHLTRAQAGETALAFLSRALTPGVETAVIDADSSPDRLSADSYTFSGQILLNGLPSPFHFTIRVSTADNQVDSFYSMGADYTQLLGGTPTASAAVGEAAAGQALKGVLSLRLEYVLSDDGAHAVLRYLPNAIDSYFVDAQTGKLVNLTELYDGLERGGSYAGAGDNAAPESSAALSGKSQLTEAELAGIAQLEGVLSADALDAAARSVSALGLSKYTLANASYTVDRETGDVTARLQYARQSDDGIWRRYVTLDGRTGALQAVSSSMPHVEGLKASVSAASAQTKAEAFLKSVCGENFAGSALYNGEDALSGELTGVQRTFVYAQQENGYFFPANSLTVGVDCTDGSVSRYTRSFEHHVDFQSPEGAIGMDAALEAWFGTYAVTLEYLAVPEKLDLSAPEYRPLIEQGCSYLYALTLAYALERESYVSGIDAMTGQAVAEPAAPEQTVSYDDLEGHWVREAAEKLAGYGVGWLGGALEPGKALTQLDLVALLVSTGGWLYDGQGGSEAVDQLYDRAYSMGILEKGQRSEEAVLTRAQAVKLLLDGTGYGAVAGLEGIFRCSFADEAQIPDLYYGYAALAQGLGIVEGAGGSFYPARTATRAEAAAMLCRFLER